MAGDTKSAADLGRAKKYVRRQAAEKKVKTYNLAKKKSQERVVEPPNRGKKQIAGPPKPSADRIRRLNKKDLFGRSGENREGKQKRYVDPLIDVDKKGKRRFKKGAGKLLKTQTRRDLDELATARSIVAQADAISRLQKRGRLPSDKDLERIAGTRSKYLGRTGTAKVGTKKKSILDDKRLLASPLGPAAIVAKATGRALNEVVDVTPSVLRAMSSLGGPEQLRPSRLRAARDVAGAVKEINVRSGGGQAPADRTLQTAGYANLDARQHLKRGLLAGANSTGSFALRQLDKPAGATMAAVGKGLAATGQLSPEAEKKIKKARGPWEVLKKGRRWDKDISAADVLEGVGLPKELGLPVDVGGDPLMYGGLALAPATGGTSGALAIERAVQRIRALDASRLDSEVARKAFAKHQDDNDTKDLVTTLNSLIDEDEARKLRKEGIDRTIDEELKNFRRQNPGVGEQGPRVIKGKGGKERKLYLKGSGPAAAEQAILAAQNRAVKPQLRLQLMKPTGATTRRDGSKLPSVKISRDLSGVRVPGGKAKQKQRILDAQQNERIRLEAVADREIAALSAKIENYRKRLVPDDDPRILALQDSIKGVEDSLFKAKKERGVIPGDEYKTHVPGRTLGDVFADRGFRDEIRSATMGAGHFGRMTEREVARAQQHAFSSIKAQGEEFKKATERVQMVYEIEQPTLMGKAADEIFGLTPDEVQALQGLKQVDEAQGAQGLATGSLNYLNPMYTGFRSWETPIDRIATTMQRDPRLRSAATSSQHGRSVQSMFDLADRDFITRRLQELSRKDLSDAQARQMADAIHDAGRQRFFSELAVRQMQRNWGSPMRFDSYTPSEQFALSRSARGFAGKDEPLFRTPNVHTDTEGYVLPGERDGFPSSYGLTNEPYDGLTSARRSEAMLDDIRSDIARVEAALTLVKNDEQLLGDLNTLLARLREEEAFHTNGLHGTDVAARAGDDVARQTDEYEDVDGVPVLGLPSPKDPPPAAPEAPRQIGAADPFDDTPAWMQANADPDFLTAQYEQAKRDLNSLKEQAKLYDEAKLRDVDGSPAIVSGDDVLYYVQESVEDPDRFAVWKYDVEEGDEIEVATYASLKNAEKGMLRRFEKDKTAFDQDWAVVVDRWNQLRPADDAGELSDAHLNAMAYSLGLAEKPTPRAVIDNFEQKLAEEADIHFAPADGVPRQPTEPGPETNPFEPDYLPAGRGDAPERSEYETVDADPVGGGGSAPPPGGPLARTDETVPNYIPESGKGDKLPDIRGDVDFVPELDPIARGLARARQQGVQVGFASRWQGVDNVYGRSLDDARDTYRTADGEEGFLDELNPLMDENGQVYAYAREEYETVMVGEVVDETSDVVADVGSTLARSGTGVDNPRGPQAELPVGDRPKATRVTEEKRVVTIDAADVELAEGTLIKARGEDLWLDPRTGETYQRARSALGEQTPQVQVIGDDRVWPSRVLAQVQFESHRLGEGTTLYDEAMIAGLGNLQKAMAATRFGVTLPFPAYHLRNLYSDIIKSLQADSSVMFHPLDNAKLSKAAFNRGLNHEIDVPGYGKLPMEEFLLIADTFGVRTGHQATEIAELLAIDDPKKFDKFSRKVFRNLQTFSGHREDVVRLQTFMQRMRSNGGDAADASWYMVRHHFDYNDLSAFERRTVRNLFLFYTWYRKNIPLQLTELVRRPGFFSTMNHTYQNLEQGQTPLNVDVLGNPFAGAAPINPARPDYLKDKLQAVTLAWKGQALDVAFGAPWSDLGILSEDLPQTLLSMGTPLVGGFLLTRREDPVTGRRYRDREPGGAASILEAVVPGDTLMKDEKGRPTLPWEVHAGIRQLPFFGRASGAGSGINPSLDPGRLQKAGKYGQILHGLNLSVAPKQGSARETLGIENLIKAEVVAKRREALIDLSNLNPASKEYKRAMKKVDATAAVFAARKGIDKKYLKAVKQSGFYTSKEQQKSYGLSGSGLKKGLKSSGLNK